MSQVYKAGDAIRRRQFFAPIPATFRYRKGADLSDQDLLRAWARCSTDDVRRLAGVAVPDPWASRAENARTRKIRERVLRLREEQEAARDG